MRDWVCLTCLSHVQFAIEDVVGAYGMINYVDARTAWMDDIVKKAQADDISQARKALISDARRYPSSVQQLTQAFRRCSALRQPDFAAVMQVVIIAAGYCTRAYRLRTGNTQVTLTPIRSLPYDCAQPCLPT